MGEIVREYTYYILGFVPYNTLDLKNNAWFHILDHEQVGRVEKYLCARNYL